MVTQGFRFIGISPEVDLTERRSQMLNDQTEPFTSNDIIGYRVYTALLSQSGTESYVNITSGLLTVGVTYKIDDASGNPDFTNVGAPSNALGTFFTATGTTPASWGSATLEYNPGAPEVIVLQNTIGSVSWGFSENGVYFTPESFDITRTTVNLSNNSLSNGTYTDMSAWLSGDGNVFVDSTSNGVLNNTTIEIRVYN
jgi:hypothetical protein